LVQTLAILFRQQVAVTVELTTKLVAVGLQFGVVKTAVAVVAVR
jgi:hypothetical protein